MKVAVVQFEPVPRNVSLNLRKAAALLDSVAGRLWDEIEMLVFSELFATGYCFQGHDDILPFCEIVGIDEDSQGSALSTRPDSADIPALATPCLSWVRQQAQSRRVWIQYGFPRRSTVLQSSRPLLYNSLALVDPQGRVRCVYDKTHLYELDEKWAEEGSGFMSYRIEDDPASSLGRELLVGFGICMDLNPYQFRAPFESFEWASWHAHNGSQLLVCSMAWCLHKDDPRDEHHVISSDTLNYWAQRSLPLIQKSKTGDDIYMIVSNRVGVEQGSRFVGTSCVLRYSQEKARLVASLGVDDEAVLVVDVM
ncbi:Carbon-nitrogen hydrolase [Kappamyces sp. JEL0829]|nr:Carbon-nitrogen hydrolase [Kappamyces sp. JEL0829]